LDTMPYGFRSVPSVGTHTLDFIEQFSDFVQTGL
jgi:hypothetical protein